MPQTLKLQRLLQAQKERVSQTTSRRVSLHEGSTVGSMLPSYQFFIHIELFRPDFLWQIFIQPMTSLFMMLMASSDYSYIYFQIRFAFVYSAIINNNITDYLLLELLYLHLISLY